jgi:hypothetical protein
MAGGGNGGRPSSAILGKLSPTEKISSTALQTRSKLCLVVTMACAVACIYAFSAITKPCSQQSQSFTNATTGVIEELAPYDRRMIALDRDDPETKREGGGGLEGDAAYRARYNASLENVVFGIAASAKLWRARKNYVRLWWQRKTMRGYVWLDKPVNATWDADVPPFRLSANTSQFKYSRRRGNRAALRLSRIVTETFRLGLQNVDWFVMGDDDTVFFTDNLVRVLSNYDPAQMHYIGSQSESHVQNTLFSYSMAYGGGGFAISYALAKALAATQDGCLNRYRSCHASLSLMLCDVLYRSAMYSCCAVCVHATSLK